MPAAALYYGTALQLYTRAPESSLPRTRVPAPADPEALAGSSRARGDTNYNFPEFSPVKKSFSIA